MKKLSFKFFITLFITIFIGCTPVYGLHKLALDVHGGAYEFGELDGGDIIVPFYTWSSSSIEPKYLDDFYNLPERTLIYCNNEDEYEKIYNLSLTLCKLGPKLEYMWATLPCNDARLVKKENKFIKCEKTFFELFLNILKGKNPYFSCTIL